ncbi:MAG: bifunctional nuclease family protein [bacterium]
MGDDIVQVEVYCVRFDVFNKIPVVLLKDISRQRFLPIWIGMFEATQIEIALEKIHVPRPMTHDLMKSILDTLSIELQQIVIHTIIEGTFHAKMIIREHGGNTMEVDARPSDAIALSLRTETPIFVSKRILDEASIEGNEPDEEEIRKFKDFISNIKPSDFKD